MKRFLRHIVTLRYLQLGCRVSSPAFWLGGAEGGGGSVGGRCVWWSLSLSLSKFSVCLAAVSVRVTPWPNAGSSSSSREVTTHTHIQLKVFLFFFYSWIDLFRVFSHLWLVCVCLVEPEACQSAAEAAVRGLKIEEPEGLGSHTPIQKHVPQWSWWV